MKVTQLATALACMLALAGCPSSKLPLADSNNDGGDDESPIAPPVRGHEAQAGSSGEVAGPVLGTDGTAGGHAGDPLLDAGGTDPAVPGRDAGNVGNPAPLLDAGVTDPAVPGRDDGNVGNAHLDAGSPAIGQTPQLMTLSPGCQRVADAELCFGEGWMLAAGEALPACNESGAYRICTFANGGCVSHTVMMLQRCD